MLFPLYVLPTLLNWFKGHPIRWGEMVVCIIWVGALLLSSYGIALAEREATQLTGSLSIRAKALDAYLENGEEEVC